MQPRKEAIVIPILGPACARLEKNYQQPEKRGIILLFPGFHGEKEVTMEELASSLFARLLPELKNCASLYKDTQTGWGAFRTGVVWCVVVVGCHSTVDRYTMI